MNGLDVDISPNRLSCCKITLCCRLIASSWNKIGMHSPDSCNSCWCLHFRNPALELLPFPPPRMGLPEVLDHATQAEDGLAARILLLRLLLNDCSGFTPRPFGPPQAESSCTLASFTWVLEMTSNCLAAFRSRKAAMTYLRAAS